jgi:hypothetical protein
VEGNNILHFCKEIKGAFEDQQNLREEPKRGNYKTCKCKLERPIPVVKIATSTQGLILGVTDAMVMHVVGGKKVID